MHTTSPPFWWMRVSRATAVLPVWRSPMISSRWPRPIGIIESIALSPVAIGTFTCWDWTTPGAIYTRVPPRRGRDRALVGGRVAERVDHAAKHPLTDRDLEQAGRPLHGVAFDDFL